MIIFINFVVITPINMVDILNLFNIKEKIAIDSKKLPKHVALTTDGNFLYAEKNKIDFDEVCRTKSVNIKNVIKVATKLGVPIVTFNILSERLTESEHFSVIMDSLVDFFKNIKDWEYLHENQIKLSVMGKWYDLPGRLVDAIKEAVESTKDYDKFFVNFCVNYSGQEEIIDACRIILRQIQAGKLDSESISPQTIKDNLYTSYFIPPDLIIRTGKNKTLRGFLLWDSQNAKIHFAGKYWPEFSKTEFLRAIEDYQKD